MNYHRHAIPYRPEPQKPTRYRTRRTLAQRMRPLLVIALFLFLVAACVTGVVQLIDAVSLNDARLDTAYLQGMKAGQSVCGSH